MPSIPNLKILTIAVQSNKNVDMKNRKEINPSSMSSRLWDLVCGSMSQFN